MNTKKLLALTLSGVLLVGCLTGCSTAAAPRASASGPSLSAAAEDEWAGNDVPYEEQFKPYEQFGLTYDAAKNELQYNGKVVRWHPSYRY